MTRSFSSFQCSLVREAVLLFLSCAPVLGTSSESIELELTLNKPRDELASNGKVRVRPSSQISEVEENQPAHVATTFKVRAPQSRRSMFMEHWGWKEERTVNIDWPTLDQILAIETTAWSSLRWAHLDRTLERLCHSLILDFGGLGHTSETFKDHGKSSWSRFWLHGSSIPLQSTWTLKKAVSTDSFRQGIEFAFAQGLNLTLYALLLYQAVQPDSDVLQVYRNGNSNSILAISDKFRRHQNLMWIFASPFVWGTLRGLYSFLTVDQVTLQTLEEMQAKLPLPGLWTDYGRWYLPLHPIHRFLGSCERLLMWEGRSSHVSDEARESAFHFIQQISQNFKGLTKIDGLHSLARIAYGIHVQDLDKLRGVYPSKTLQQMVSLKTRALQQLKGIPLDSYVSELYRNYYLWSLGQSPSFFKTSLPMVVLRGARLTLQALSLYAIARTIMAYLNCPEKPGISFTGYQPWSSSYTQPCFDELVRQFNQIPGQPAHTLTDVLPLYHFSTGTYSLNLANKGIEGAVIVDILKGFAQNSITLTGLDVSGNLLDTSDKLDAFFQVLPQAVQTLRMGGIILEDSPEWVEAVGRGINRRGITSLDLSNNWIGFLNSNSTFSLGQTLRGVPNLQVLNLNGDYSGNYIGYTDSEGEEALGKALETLTFLTDVNFSNNNIGYMDSNGTICIIKGLQRSAATLQNLNFFGNWIGFTDSAGEVALGHALTFMNSLQELDLSWTNIGETSSKGTTAIAQGLYGKTNLHKLRLYGAYLGYTDDESMLPFERTFGSLKNLQILDMFPSYFKSDTVKRFQKALAINPGTPLLPIPLDSVSSVEAFFKEVPLTVRALNFSCLLKTADPLTLNTLMNHLANYSFLTSLDVSYNFLGNEGFDKLMVLSQGLPNLSQLTKLYLSFNRIGYTESQGLEILAQALQHLTNLRILDLSSNYIDYTDSNGTVSLGEALPYLSNLEELNIGNTHLGLLDSRGVVAVAQGLKPLEKLSSVILSMDFLGLADTQGEEALAISLFNKPTLTYLDFYNSYLGYAGGDGTIALGQSFGNLSNLVFLDVSGNYWGQSSVEEDVALGGILPSLKKLQTIRLGYNSMGKQGTNGTQKIITALPQMPNLQDVEVQGISGVEWTEGAAALANLNNANLRKVCDNQLCFGGSVPTQMTRQPLITSSASRLKSPWIFQVLSYSTPSTKLFLSAGLNPLRSSLRTLSHSLVRSYHTVIQKLSEYSPVSRLGQFVSDSYDAVIDSTVDNLKEVTANSPAYFPNINHSYISDWQPNPFTKIGQQSTDYASLAPYAIPQLIVGNIPYHLTHQ